MTITIKPLVETLRNIGLKLRRFFYCRSGENSEQRSKRQHDVLEAAVRSVTGKQNPKLDEIVVDCTNQLRHDFARAVLCGLRKFGGNVPQSADDVDTFIAAASNQLFASCHHVGQLALASGAEYVVLVLDEGYSTKEKMLLLDKHRHSSVTSPPSKHDSNKLSSFLAYCQKHDRTGGQSATKTRGEAEQAVKGILAELLHRTTDGQRLIRLLLLEMVKQFGKEFPKLKLSLVEGREADIATVDCGWTFRNGEMLQRGPGERVAVMQNDADLATQFTYRAQPAQPGLFVQLFTSIGDRSTLVARTPATLQQELLLRMARLFALLLKPGDLLLDLSRELTLHQKVALMLFTGPGMTDYKTLARDQISSFLRDEHGTLPLESYLQVLRAFVANVLKQEQPDISYAHLQWVAAHGTMSYFDDAAGGCRKRTRVANALKDVSNLREMMYGALSRLLIIFPRAVDRKYPLEAVLSFFPAQRMQQLYESDSVRLWIDEARKTDFPLRAIATPANIFFVGDFLRTYFIPKSKSAIPKQPATIKALKWSHMNLFGVLGADESANQTAKKQQQRKATALSAQSALPAKAMC